MLIAEILIDLKNQETDKLYTYRVPDVLSQEIPPELLGLDRLFDESGHAIDEEQKLAEFPVENSVEVGCAVLVPFGKRWEVGIVLSLEEHPSCDVHPLPDVVEQAEQEITLKDLGPVLSKPYFTQAGAECISWLAQEYAASLNACAKLFVPRGALPQVQNVNGHWRLTRPVVAPIEETWVIATPQAASFEPRANAVKQRTILDALAAGPLRLADLTHEYGSVSSTLKALEKKGVIQQVAQQRIRGEVPLVAQQGIRPQLTNEQAAAVALIDAAADDRNGQVVVVDGVTGSGKTEVYLRTIERQLECGRGAIVLVPEISLTPQTVARFRARFGDTVSVLHSRMSHGERFDQWRRIQAGDARVVVGARSALFAPLKEVGLIIIDEEHESSYKQDQAPRYVTRTVAAHLANEYGATLVLGSATPAIETLFNHAKDPRWHAVVLSQRANGRSLPPVQVVDMAHEFANKNRSMFSHALKVRMTQALKEGHKVVLFLNQRGFAKFLLCRDCGYVPQCPHCSTSLTYHEVGATLRCHHCGYEQRVPAVCPECGSPYLKRFGAGTQRLEAELKELLSTTDVLRDQKVRIVRMDADTTQRKGSHQKLLEEFAQPGAAVLLGTQMIAKGLDFDEVVLVGVIDADSMLNLPDFRSRERTFNMIQQVAGRCGRGALPGEVIVQSYSPNDSAIKAAAMYDRAAFLKTELPLRKLLKYPPYARLANFLLWGKDEDEVRSLAQLLAKNINDHLKELGLSDSWELLPACACVLARLKGVYRYHILVKAPPASDVAGVLDPIMRTRPRNPQVHVALDIDPYSLL